MAKRRPRLKFSGQRPAPIDSLDQCRFWQRLDELSIDERSQDRKRDVDHLKSSVRKVAERAQWISTQVCRFMPQYTLHEERHFLNVLTIMDALVPDEALAEFGAMDCAMPILSAFTHDLGMALSQSEYGELHDESTAAGRKFAAYRTRFDEELRQRARWQRQLEDLAEQKDAKSEGGRAAARMRIDAIDGHILASYLRETHTDDEQVRRLRHWLEKIKEDSGDDKLYFYGNFDYQRVLALIGISHGRNALWLRLQLTAGGASDRFYQSVGTGETANLAFPGLLLRLADILDFDASRAPRILFRHFGIDDDQSVLEWNKHLSIIGWRLDVDPTGKQQTDLVYSADCQHPVHEKAIREFACWIDSELSAVRFEIDAQRRLLPTAALNRCALDLPSQTRLDIRAARDPITDHPKYVYHDLQFRLDQHEIQQLLMGESLYGDPGLCLRELIQNSLDALEMRELRLKMKQKGKSCEPVDGDSLRSGWVRELDGREEQLRITLEWGTDPATEQQWLRITDNGIGMTEDVIKRYFTQIGKSYYRSPEFSQERAAMRAEGEIISPISIFGIGILSCFMLADRLVVRTNPGDTEAPGRESRDIYISGPGSLFWLQHGTRASQGTEITLYLKDAYLIQPNRHSDLRIFLRAHFGYGGYEKPPTSEGNKRLIDPSFYAMASTVWPRYPIDISTAGIKWDDRNHLDWLLPLSESEETLQNEWFCDERLKKGTNWTYVEWNDTHEPDATGSRLRIWFPQNSLPAEMSVHSGMLPAVVEAAFARNGIKQFRSQTAVNSMFVPTNKIFADWDPLAVAVNQVGGCVWTDLRGPLAPRLTADRNTAVLPTDSSYWNAQLDAFATRALNGTLACFRRREPSSSSPLLSLSIWPRCFNLYGGAAKVTDRFNLCEFVESKSGRNDQEGLNQLYLRFAQSMNMDRSRIGPVVREYHLGSESLFSSAIYFDQTHRRRHNDPEQWTIAYLERLLSTNTAPHFLPHPDQFHQTIDNLKKSVRAIPAPDFARHLLHECASTFEACHQAAVLQEGFFPNLRKSWPFLELFSMQGMIGDATLVAPAIVKFQCTNEVVEFADRDGTTPRELVRRGFNVSFPMVAVPVGKLRRECSPWRTDRWYRPLGVAPFLMPHMGDAWHKSADYLQDLFKVSEIYALFPRYELWSKPFGDWTESDWSDRANLSALWDLSGELTGVRGKILWARGACDIQEMPKIGLEAMEFARANLRPTDSDEDFDEDFV